MSIFSNNSFVTTYVMPQEEYERLLKEREMNPKAEEERIQKRQQCVAFFERINAHCQFLQMNLIPVYNKYSKEFDNDWGMVVKSNQENPPRFFVEFIASSNFNVSDQGISYDGYDFEASTQEILEATKFYTYLLNSEFLKELNEVINSFPFTIE